MSFPATRRVKLLLSKDGFNRDPGHNQIARIMHIFGLNAKVRKARNYKISLNKASQLADGTVLQNKLNRQFNQEKPFTFFCSDVTYVWTQSGWLYVSPVIDLATREIVSCEMSTIQDINLAVSTIKSIKNISQDGGILHTDRGAIYRSIEFRKIAKNLNLDLSYSRTGNCWDNSIMEQWNSILKTEWMYHPSFCRHKNIPSLEEAKLEITDFVNYYNNKRVQDRLHGCSPVEYRNNILSKLAC